MGRRFGLAAAATAMFAMLGGGLGFVHTLPSAEVRATQPSLAGAAEKARQQGKHQMTRVLAAREVDRILKHRRALAAIKTRGPGERAHRRWRKRRSAGRA